MEKVFTLRENLFRSADGNIPSLPRQNYFKRHEKFKPTNLKFILLHLFSVLPYPAEQGISQMVS
jgi:hypothetical protein